MSDEYGNGAVQVEAGREAPASTSVVDWVALSGISPEAHSLYVKLRMHLNHRSGVSFPTTDALALLMGYARGDKITRFLTELVAIGAIEIKRKNMPRRNVYVVHSMPPADFDGPPDLKDWYARHRPLLAARSAEARRKRGSRKDAQVSAVPPERGEQLATPNEGTASTPETGGTVAPKRGEQSPPFGGGNPLSSLNPLKNNPPPPAPRPRPGPGGNPEGGEATSPHEATIAAVRALRPTWTATAIRRALDSDLVQEREADCPGAAAFALVALAEGRYGPTTAPGRLRADGPWWADAETTLRRVPAQTRATCTQPGCHHGKITVERRNLPDVVIPCPHCRPQQYGARVLYARAKAELEGLPEILGFDDLVCWYQRCDQEVA